VKNPTRAKRARSPSRRSASKCRSGEYLRKSYVRKDGKRVRASCAKKPKRTGSHNAWIKHVKKYGGKGYSREELRSLYYKEKK